MVSKAHLIRTYGADNPELEASPSHVELIPEKELELEILQTLKNFSLELVPRGKSFILQAVSVEDIFEP